MSHQVWFYPIPLRSSHIAAIYLSLLGLMIASWYISFSWSVYLTTELTFSVDSEHWSYRIMVLELGRMENWSVWWPIVLQQSLNRNLGALQICFRGSWDCVFGCRTCGAEDYNIHKGKKKDIQQWHLLLLCHSMLIVEDNVLLEYGCMRLI